MVDINNIKTQIETVDQLPVIYGLLKKMSVQKTIDNNISAHGNWKGLSPGWVLTIWLMHIISQATHQMDVVQEWVSKHLVILRKLTGQPVTELDFTDDRLAICLRYISSSETWSDLEKELTTNVIQVYDLKNKLPDHWVLRLDATVGAVHHDPDNHTLFQVGKGKDGLFKPLFKLMVASLDPIGLPVAVDVVPGNRADDPLYLPAYRRVKQTVPGQGLLVVGDSKMSAFKTRAGIANGDDYYLTPLAHLKDEPKLLETLLTPWIGKEEELELLYLEQDLPALGESPDPTHAIARGFEVSRQHTVIIEGKDGKDGKPVPFKWDERLVVVRSFGYTETMRVAFQRRLTKAEAELQALASPRGRGKRKITDEASLRLAVTHIEKKHKVKGLFNVDYHEKVTERHIRGYKGKPARTETQSRWYLSFSRQEEAILMAEFKMGWRIYATNAPETELSRHQAVWAYRSQYVAENVFRRLKGKLLSITPVYVERDDHAQGLFHLLTLASRLLALGDYTAKVSLAQENEPLTGIFAGNPKRGTMTPTTERLLRAFDHIHLVIIQVGDKVQYQLTPLTAVQERILMLLGLPKTLYTDLQLV